MLRVLCTKLNKVTRTCDGECDECEYRFRCYTLAKSEMLEVEHIVEEYHSDGSGTYLRIQL